MLHLYEHFWSTLEQFDFNPSEINKLKKLTTIRNMLSGKLLFTALLIVLISYPIVFSLNGGTYNFIRLKKAQIDYRKCVKDPNCSVTKSTEGFLSKEKAMPIIEGRYKYSIRESTIEAIWVSLIIFVVTTLFLMLRRYLRYGSRLD